MYDTSNNVTISGVVSDASTTMAAALDSSATTFTHTSATEIDDSSLAWLSEARNKHSITLNLKAPEGVELLKRLVRQTDVICENFRPGTIEKWG